MTNKFSDSLFFRVEPDLMEALTAEAEARGPEANKSTVAREVLREGLFKKKTKRKTKSKKSQRDKVVPLVYEVWDQSAPKGIARPRATNDRRTAKIMARYAEQPDLNKWKAGIILMFASNRGFYLGKNDCILGKNDCNSPPRPTGGCVYGPV